MRALLKELGVTITLLGRQVAPKEKIKIFAVYHNNNKIGLIEVRSDGRNTYIVSGDVGRTGQHREFIECVISLLTYHKIYMRTDITSMVKDIKSDNVVVKVGDISILHNRELGDPDSSIRCLCQVTYVRVPDSHWESCSVNKSFAIIDFERDKFLLLNGKELETSNSMEMIDRVRVLILGGKNDQNKID